jgi:hypothetical protein
MQHHAGGMTGCHSEYPHASTESKPGDTLDVTSTNQAFKHQVRGIAQ